MRIFKLRTGLAVIACAALPSLSACVNVSSLDCSEIANEAKRISQNQPVKIQNVTNVHETRRADSDARCEGNATMSDGSTGTLYLRAYQENGNTMVAYQGTPFQ